MDISMKIYFLALYFFVYGFLGWCTEVAFAGFQRTSLCKPWLFKWSDLPDLRRRSVSCDPVPYPITGSFTSPLHSFCSSRYFIGGTDRMGNG